jgi:mono/diheme cytochrome c family protein
MPYAAYTYMTDADALAIKAYLFGLKPVHAPARANTLSFPANQRWLMAVWSSLFNPDRRFEPNPERSVPWNRGAYLVEAMAHCGDCHTPRNSMQALNNRAKFAGTVISGWRAYNITSDRDSGVGAWSDADLSQYLAIGHADMHGAAAGPMSRPISPRWSLICARCRPSPPLICRRRMRNQRRPRTRKAWPRISSRVARRSSKALVRAATAGAA